MEEEKIFGSNITLPSLPDLQSACEEEILFLMKEVDAEFQMENHSLLTDLSNVRALCDFQRKEIENLKKTQLSNNEAVQNDKLKDKVQQCSLEIEKLKKENIELKTENIQLRSSLRRMPNNGCELETLKRSLSVQEEENKVLKQKLSKMEEQYQHLQNNYKKMIDAYVSLKQNGGNQEISPENDDISAADFNAKMTEKILSDENTFGHDFLFKFGKGLEDFEKEIHKPMS